jgi:succinyl-diaminopimelate desuccinylase
MNAINPTLALTQDLLARPSITPDDAGCQKLIAERLEKLGFRCEFLRFGEVENLWARLGDQEPLLVLAGHTDVVPPGDISLWHSDPFSPTLRDGLLFARGAADMKTSLAAMVTATEAFLAKRQPIGSIAFLLTSDEEGPSINGTVKVVELLEKRAEKITWALVGEPSSAEKLGDRIRVGRRGSLTGYLTVRGKQGHVAYPEQVKNPIHQALSVMNNMAETVWDYGNTFFPPTSFQWVDVKSGIGATNVVPGQLTAVFNLRFNSEQTAEGLELRIRKMWQDIDHQLNFVVGGQPFLTSGGALLKATQEAIAEVCQLTTECSTGGGTSDGRFIAPTGAEIVELGPINASIHKIDEHIAVADVIKLHDLYLKILEKLL